jgi:hypothetical protein
VGAYVKSAESTFKNGRRIRVANANGPALLRVDNGRVVYDQTYYTNGEIRRVVQVYTFGPRDLRPIGGGDMEAILTFRSMSGDTQNYNPDMNNPRLEAHRTGSGWALDLFTTDTRGVVGIVEFQ